MKNLPTLDELLNYGEEYQYPTLLMDDYVISDNTSKNEPEDLNQENDVQSEPEDLNSENNTQSEPQDLNQENNIESESQDLNSENNTQSEPEDLNSENNIESESQDLNQENNIESEPEDLNQENDAQSESEDLNQENNIESEPEDLNQENDENNFDDLMDNYDENYTSEHDSTQDSGERSASNKLNDITNTKIYKVLKKLVSMSYEKYQKGTYKYNRKEIVKHYLTSQKFKIIDDLESPIFKPDVYVFDLSPSNNESLEMYVNAISSVAIKNSIIYLTYNESILRKLLIRKAEKNIDVNKIVNSEIKYYHNLECTIFNEYRSFYEELKDIKDRKIYVFSDFDISDDISKLSQKNENIVWFSTEKKHKMYNYYREYPSSYIGYYVETNGIDDIEKFINEKNKNKYKGRIM